MAPPVTRICVTPGTSMTAYTLLPYIGQGDLTGPGQEVEVILHDVESRMNVLKGNCMEIQDSVFPVVTGISATCSWQHALSDVDVLFVLPAVPFSRHHTEVHPNTHQATPSVRHGPEHMQIVLVGTVNDLQRFQTVNPSLPPERLHFLDITGKTVRPMSLSHIICQSFREWRLSLEKESLLKNMLNASALTYTNKSNVRYPVYTSSTEIPGSEFARL